MNTEQQIKALVDELIDHAYDSGYYSGQKLDGQPLHEQAIHSRNHARRRIIKAFVKACNERDALRQELTRAAERAAALPF